ncbi:MAG: squalene/phytoene synthase family protein [Parvularculaceae bacterium]
MNREAEIHLSALIRTHDEDRWLAARYAPAAARRTLLALYAFHVELARIPAIVSEPPLGEIRLQWLRQALAEMRAGRTAAGHPVLKALAAAGVVDDDAAAALEGAIDARSRLLYADEPFRDAEDLAGWLARAESYLEPLAASALGADARLCAAAGEAGLAFALARSGLVLAPQLADETATKAQTLYTEAQPRLRRAPANCAPALAHLSLTPAYLKRGPTRRPFPVEKRARIFLFMLTGRV